MIQLLTPGATQLRPSEAGQDLPADALWIDLLEPSKDEEALVEKFLGIDIPTREEMREIEESSRLYREGEAVYMTIRVIFGMDTGQPRTRAITFVLTERCLATVRYINPHAFRNFEERFAREHAPAPANGAEVFVELLERIVDRIADVLEGVENDLERISDVVFHEDEAEVDPEKKSERKDAAVVVANGKTTECDQQELPTTVNLQKLLKRLGRHNAAGARLRESLLSITRLLPFLCGTHAPLPDNLHERLQTLERDVKSLSEFDSQVAQEIEFLLDATLGLINLEQNNIIKVFTIVATLLMPPTVIGSIYGMNFKNMPELDWHYGYPFALALMVLSAAIPYWWFKKKGWV